MKEGWVVLVVNLMWIIINFGLLFIVFTHGSITKSSSFFKIIPKQSIQPHPDPHLTNSKRIKQSNNPSSTIIIVENDRLQNRK